MEEKLKSINQNEDNQNLSSINFSLNQEFSYNFDNIYKNKELNKFKEDILSFMREKDKFYFQKLKEVQIKSDVNNKNIDRLSEVMDSNFKTLLSKQVDVGSKLEKIKSYDAFINKANDKLISHEIRINSLREDLTKSNQKYDKIYLENLEVPGYIGRSSKYPNCKLFFVEVIKELDKFNNYREKNIIDLSTYKERLESIIKTFQSLVDNNNDSQIKYITKLNDKTSKNILEIIDDKLNNLRMENSHYSINLIKKSNELNILYDEIKLMKDYISNKFNSFSEEYTKKLDETNKSFDEFKVEYEIIRKKFFELADFIKNGKYTRKIGVTIGRRDLNLITKKLNKDLKDSIDPKEIKLMNNIKEIEKIDFQEKKAIEHKNKVLCNNDINIRLSKSQNNFNNNIGKKKVFGFGYNAGNNNHKYRYSTDNEKEDIKIKQGLLFYSKGNNTNAISKKNISSKIKITKNIKTKDNKDNKDNKDFNKENIKKINIMPIEKPKSQRATQVQTENTPRTLKEKRIIDKDDYPRINKEENDKKINDELSMSESSINNINNSINTFSTTNEKNNSFNAININNNKVGKFNLFESKLEHNDKVIKELASELEQSTAKVNQFGSNKKEMEKKFKTICKNIPPINLKGNKQLGLDKIEEYTEKNNIITNKSEQNTTIHSINVNNNIEKTNMLTRNNKMKLKELIELTEKLDENTNLTKSHRLLNISRNNESINCNNIDKRMNEYDKKFEDLESLIKEQILEIIKQIGNLQKNYLYLTNIIKGENKNLNSAKTKECNISENIILSPKGDEKILNNNIINNENKNIMNLTSNYFHKKTSTFDANSRLFSNSKKIFDDINLSDNLFYNGKYYFNIKDILGKKKEKNIINNYQFENKKLLKAIDKKLLNDDKIKLTKNNSSFEGVIENKCFNLNKAAVNNNMSYKTLKP